jgi:hypothetical protein
MRIISICDNAHRHKQGFGLPKTSHLGMPSCLIFGATFHRS